MNPYLLLKKQAFKICRKYFPKMFVKHKYKKTFGEKLNLSNPKGFNEKILWLTMYWQKPIIVQCADKYTLRKYVKSVLGEKGESLLPKLYGVYTDVNTIEWNQFPNQFVIKCTHGCKWNIVCLDKANFNIDEAKQKLTTWMNSVYGIDTYEPQYAKMTPRIIAEEFIKTKEKTLPEDYKIYCFNGEPKIVLVCLNRDVKLKLEWYDLKWNVVEIGAEKNTKAAMKPECLYEMIKYAKMLSKGFPFVRVDFYDSFGKPILGEMTFTPMYGMARYYSQEGNIELGKLLQLPEKYKGHYN